MNLNQKLQSTFIINALINRLRFKPTKSDPVNFLHILIQRNTHNSALGHFDFGRKVR